MFIGYGTWKWIETHARTGGAPVYRYSFDRKIPVPADETVNGMPATVARHRRPARRRDRVRLRQPRLTEGCAVGADRSHALRRDDQLLGGLRPAPASRRPRACPKWPRYARGKGQVLHLDEKIAAKPDTLRPRYEALDAYHGAAAVGRWRCGASSKPPPK